MADEKRYALVNTARRVTNIILWDGETNFEPPDGETLCLATGSVEPGWLRIDSGVFVAPETTANEE